ncbi:MAG: polymer-forming cytoskeletal protein [Oceanospirillales bacterium]|nr:polymer-forming cytoskeletal protein [Oceanospirillales bacterium]
MAQGNRFHGETSISGKMHVDGEFEGSIDSSDDISIGKTGRICGRIRAHAVNVSGELEGELICDSLHIERGGRVCANVYCSTLSIDPDGTFVGERHLPGQQHRLTWDVEARTMPEPEPLSDAQDLVIDLETGLIDSLPDRITLSRK